MKRGLAFLMMLQAFVVASAQELPEGWVFVPTPASGLFLGQVTLDGSPAAAEDFIGAFLPAEGVCVGYSAVVMSGGTAYFNLPVYGDDALTGTVEGPTEGGSVELRLYSSALEAEMTLLDDAGEPVLFEWTNTYGVPISGMNDPEAVFDFASVAGECADPAACNYDPSAQANSGCTYPQPGACDCSGAVEDALGVCGGACLSDINANGICDDAETPGCLYPGACNYDASATDDDGSCEFPDPGFDCDGNSISGSDCLGDISGDAVVGTSDLLLLLSVYGDTCDAVD